MEIAVLSAASRAAIDGKRDAGYVGTGAGREENHRTGDFVRTAQSRHRDRGQHCWVNLVVIAQMCGHLRGEEAWNQRVHIDVAVRQIAREIAAQHVDRGFAGRIRIGGEARGFQTRDRTDVDDAGGIVAGAACLQRGQQFASLKPAAGVRATSGAI